MSTFVFVYPKHIWEKVDNPRAYKGTDTTIGCGPYRFLSYDQASQTSHYQAVDNHFRGKPTIDYISVRSFATHAALVMALKNGEIDAVYDYGNPLEAGVVGVLQGVASVEVGTSGDPGNYQLSFGFKTDPSRDIAFRRAVKYALNYPLMASTIGGYHGAVAGGGIIAPPNRGFRADMPPLRQDKEKAGQLLDGAGYVDRDHDGFRELPNGQPLEVAVTIRFGAAQKPVYLRLFEILQRDLQDIGVRVRLDGSVNNESLWSKRTAVDRDYELYLGFTNAGIASYDSAAYTLVSVAAGGWEPATYQNMKLLFGNCWLRGITRSMTGRCTFSSSSMTNWCQALRCAGIRYSIRIAPTDLTAGFIISAGVSSIIRLGIK